MGSLWELLTASAKAQAKKRDLRYGVYLGGNGLSWSITLLHKNFVVAVVKRKHQWEAWGLWAAYLRPYLLGVDAPKDADPKA